MTDEQNPPASTPPSAAPAPQPSYGQQAPYAQPAPPYTAQPTPYGQPGYYAAARPTNPLAIVSLVLSLATVIFGITAIGGVICGHIALSQIKRTGDNGRGLALAGVIVGYVFIGIGILGIIAYIVVFAVIIGAATTSGSFSS